MLIKIELESDLYQKIQDLVNQGKYDDLIQFIKIAVGNQLQEEKVEEPGTEGYLFSQEVSPKPISTIIINSGWRKNLSKIPVEKSVLKPDYKKNTLIWSFYNRFMPVRIVIQSLGLMMAERSASWVELNELRDAAFDYALKVSNDLNEYEEVHGFKRNEKLSTGLPVSEPKKSRGKRWTKRQKDEKRQASRARFIEQIIGKPKKQEKDKLQTFTGACFNLGMFAVKYSKGEWFVSMTEIAKELATIENPVLDAGRFNVESVEEYRDSFSDDEIKIFMEKIIPNFKIENKLVNNVLSELEKKSLTSDKLDLIFEKESMEIYDFYSNKPQKLSKEQQKTLITQTRIATMGRLSELKLVNWDIESGQSIYSINKNKIGLIQLN